VTEAQAKKRMARGGKLNVNIDAVRLADGEKAALRAIKEAKGGGHTGAMTGLMLGTAIVFFPAAPLFLFMHGKDIAIPKGTEITVDGKFLGSTPSTVRLMPGDHTISVEKPGFKPWQRAVTVNSGNSITIDATLDKVL